MRYFIDFEATQPEGEIISVGVVSERGDKFYSCVKPLFSKLSPYVANLIHMTQEELDKAPTLNEVFSNLYHWIYTRDTIINSWEFIVFGNNDKDFIKTSAAALTSNEARILAGLMLLGLRDYSQEAKRFFNGNVSLIKAFNYVQSQETVQKHDALEDALMLQKVVQYIDGKKPLKVNPFLETEFAPGYKPPSGRFIAKSTKEKGNPEYEFDNCDEAITWFLTQMQVQNPEEVHKDRIMKNIMKAVRKNSTYGHYKWRRVKEEKTNE